MICTFFGHRDCPDSLETDLEKCLQKLIENENATTFYVGNQGNFDRLVHKVLKRLKEMYPHITYTIVLAYMPQNKKQPEETLLPDGIENVPRRFAICYRNRFMLKKADCVIFYVHYISSGAYTYCVAAEKAGKRCIML